MGSIASPKTLLNYRHVSAAAQNIAAAEFALHGFDVLDQELIAATKKGKGKMPEFGTKLSDTQIKEVIAYVRKLQKK